MIEKGLRRVTTAFEARGHHQEPSAREMFQVGDLVLYKRDETGHSVFTRESDPEGAAPFLVDSKTFESSTEPRYAR